LPVSIGTSENAQLKQRVAAPGALRKRLSICYETGQETNVLSLVGGDDVQTCPVIFNTSAQQGKNLHFQNISALSSSISTFCSTVTNIIYYFEANIANNSSIEIGNSFSLWLFT
jgi:hypothetical protein